MGIEYKRVSNAQVRVSMDKEDRNTWEAYDWCLEKFGKGGKGKQHKWRHGWLHTYKIEKYYFYFRDEKDAVMFMLRFG